MLRKRDGSVALGDVACVDAPNNHQQPLAVLPPCESRRLVTSNLPFNEWTEIFGSQRLTGALLDRLTHHVHMLELNGDSYRLAHSTHARHVAVQPLSGTPSTGPGGLIFLRHRGLTLVRP